MKTFSLHKNLAVFLKLLTILIAISTLFLMLWLPHLEGRNDDATVFEIYFKDPFLAYAYVASIGYFVALYKAFKLISYAERKEMLKNRSAEALRKIKFCALTLIGFIAGAEIYFFVVQRGKDDIAGGVMLGLFMILIATIVFVVASKFEQNIRNTMRTSD